MEGRWENPTPTLAYNQNLCGKTVGRDRCAQGTQSCRDLGSVQQVSGPYRYTHIVESDHSISISKAVLGRWWKGFGCGRSVL